MSSGVEEVQLAVAKGVKLLLATMIGFALLRHWLGNDTDAVFYFHLFVIVGVVAAIIAECLYTVAACFAECFYTATVCWCETLVDVILLTWRVFSR
jgi:hypothetical protein